jgi:hypothetical protein
MNDIQIFNDFLPKDLFLSIEKIIDGEDIDWHLIDSLSGWRLPKSIDGAKVCDNQQGFYHLLFENGRTSRFYETFQPIIPIIEEKTKTKIKILFRMRLGLTVAAQSGGIIYPHVDIDHAHKTFLLYLNDTDGDTFFYKEKYEGFEESNFSLLKRNPPQKNQGVLFDGLRYHSSSVPEKHNKRLAININYI